MYKKEINVGLVGSGFMGKTHVFGYAIAEKVFNLPIKFIVEDNNLSTNTPTNYAWNKKTKMFKDIQYYKYKRKFPHHGTGNWILF